MNRFQTLSARKLSVVGFSFHFAYVLSLQFEGQVLYSLLELRGIDTVRYILVAVIAHFTGLFTCGRFVKSQEVAKSMMVGGISLCLVATVPFFFPLSFLWMGGLIVSGYFSGCAVASWGFFLRTFTPKNERIKTCADVLIYSNLLMIAINVVDKNISTFIGLGLSLLCLVIGMIFIWMLPVEQESEHNKTDRKSVV